MKNTTRGLLHLLTLDARAQHHHAQLLPVADGQTMFSGTLSSTTGEFRSTGGTWRVETRGLFSRVLELRDASGQAVAQFVPRLFGLKWELQLANGVILHWHRTGLSHRYDFSDARGSIVTQFRSEHWYPDGVVHIDVPGDGAKNEPTTFAAIVMGSYVLARRYQIEPVSIL
jgi:hypothetical protein